MQQEHQTAHCLTTYASGTYIYLRQYWKCHRGYGWKIHDCYGCNQGILRVPTQWLLNSQSLPEGLFIFQPNWAKKFKLVGVFKKQAVWFIAKAMIMSTHIYVSVLTARQNAELCYLSDTQGSHKRKKLFKSTEHWPMVKHMQELHVLQSWRFHIA